jgi:hypothetical protein
MAYPAKLTLASGFVAAPSCLAEKPHAPFSREARLITGLISHPALMTLTISAATE